MKKACIFTFLGLTIFFAGLIVGVFLGQTVYGSNVTVQYTSQTEPTGTTEVTASNTKVGFLVNINTASAELLDTLPGIGPATAQKILDYRETNGPFQTKEDLLNINGIGKEKLNAIYDLITVEVEDENSGS